MLRKHRWGLRAEDIFFACGGVIILAFFLWKLPLELQGGDETFYIAIPKRILDGDCFVVDELFGGQFSAFLQLPLMWLNNHLLGFEGIVIHFRAFYVICQSLCAVVIYIRLREYGVFGALAALYFYLFTPFDIMGLSYDSMGLMLGALTAVLLATAKSKKAYYAAGVFFAGAVLCCPFLLVAYLVYSAAVLLIAVLWKKPAMGKNWLAFTLGGGSLAALLIAFILSRTSLSRFLEAVPIIFNDAGHPLVKPLFWNLVYYVFSILDMWPGSRYVILVCGIAVLIMAVDKQRDRHTNIYMTVGALASVVLVLGFIPDLIELNCNKIMIPMMATGVMAYFAAEKKDHRIFLFVILGGVAYSMCINYASLNGINVISMILTISSVGGIALLKNVWPKKGSGPFVRVCSVAICLAFVAQFGVMAYTKAHHMYWSESDVSELTETISEGPLKGIRVTEETEERYMYELKRLEPMADKTGSVLYIHGEPWYFLATPSLRVSGYTPWMGAGTEDFTKMLKLYYGDDWDKLPTYVFIMEEDEQASGPLKEQILDKYGYERVDCEGGAIYCKPEK